jgi:hypothetical protein
MYSACGIYQSGHTHEDHEGSREEKHNEFQWVFDKIGAEEGVYAQEQQDIENIPPSPGVSSTITTKGQAFLNPWAALTTLKVVNQEAFRLAAPEVCLVSPFKA